MHSGRPLRAAGTFLSLLTLLGACDHSAPFESPDTTTDEPLVDSEPVRLTYGGTAASPVWLPEGDGILLSFVDDSRDDHDRCLGTIPGTGGTLRGIFCHQGQLTTDTTDRLDQPAVSEDGLLAFVRSSAVVGALVDRERWLLVAPRSDPAAARKIRSIPFVSGGTQMTSVTSLRWVADAQLAFIAQAQTVVVPCESCEAITVESGRELTIADVSSGAPTFATIAIGGNPTSIALGSGGELYFTLAGDTRVYSRPGLTGPTTVAHDFAAHGIARAIDVSGDRLVAIVGGRVQAFDTPDGMVQADSGGALWLVDLDEGAATQLFDEDRLYRSASLAPSGDVIAAMAVPVVIETIPFTSPPVYDTTIVGPPDLWRIGEP